MRVVVAKNSLRRVLRWTQCLLFACAVSLLGYCGFVLADAWVFQRQESRYLDRLLRDSHTASGGAPKIGSSTSPKNPPAATTGGLIGRIEIPRLGLSAVVVEGIDSAILQRAVGHIPGTALPGQPGNVGIAGHRDTFFRPLRSIRKGDEITVTTLHGSSRYRVDFTKVVQPENIEVLDGSDDALLTLVTCYPFDYVGSAPKRFIVRAHRIPG